MKRFGYLVLLFALLAGSLVVGAEPVESRRPLRVVTTFFPLTDWARAIGGDRVRVHQLLPPGVEAHTFSPRPADMRAIQEADVFLFLGPDMEPWARRLAPAPAHPRQVILEVAKRIPRVSDGSAHADHEKAEGPPTHTDDGDAHEHDHVHRGPHPHASHDHADTDPHVWLDPVLAQQMVRAIAEAFAQADPDSAEIYRANARAYMERLADLHQRIEATLRRVRHREILFAGHFVFGYFARRYGLDYRSAYPGFAPDAMPTPHAVAELIRRIRETGQQVIFHEELVDPKVARVIAEETGARLVMLHGAHNLTPEEARRGTLTYLTIMEDNLRKLAEALGANEPD